ncbi:MAG: peptidoglycan-associated lipoprotein Pal [Pseudomonadota bacterium]
MRTHILSLAVIAAVGLSACSSTDEMENDDMTVSASGETFEAGPLGADDTMGAGVDGFESASLGAGTQAQLVSEIGDRVFFGYDRFDLNDEARDLLNRQATWLNQYGSLTVTVEGHADERGTREYNLALGERRADSVKNYLISMGVDPRRINTISYGKEQPAVLGANPSSWAQNRRGVTRVD